MSTLRHYKFLELNDASSLFFSQSLLAFSRSFWSFPPAQAGLCTKKEEVLTYGEERGF